MLRNELLGPWIIRSNARFLRISIISRPSGDFSGLLVPGSVAGSDGSGRPSNRGGSTMHAISRGKIISRKLRVPRPSCHLPTFKPAIHR